VAVVVVASDVQRRGKKITIVAVDEAGKTARPATFVARG
jgi:hypothetical protein